MSDFQWFDIPLSSNVKRVAYREDPPAMLVEWVKGRVSEYDGVDPETFEKVRKAPSVGSALNELVKGKFEHHYV